MRPPSKIRLERYRRGLTLRDVATQLRMSPSRLSYLERGYATPEDHKRILAAIALAECDPQRKQG